jgi:hypothetical protein
MSAEETIADNKHALAGQEDKYGWLDIFYHILVSPVKTFAIINSSRLYSSDFSAIIGAMLAVVVAALADSGITSLSVDGLFLSFSGSVISDLFFWLTLAMFLRLLAAVMKINAPLRSCLRVTGWSFVPLVLKAPAACFSNVTILGDVLSLIISVWFLVLVLVAFDSLLKLGRLKTLVFILFLPPCLFFSYFVSMIFANKFIFDGSF